MSDRRKTHYFTPLPATENVTRTIVLTACGIVVMVRRATSDPMDVTCNNCKYSMEFRDKVTGRIVEFRDKVTGRIVR